MHVRVWLHKTEAFVSGGTQDKFFLVPTKTGMAITVPGGFFFWTRFENLVAKRRKINDRVAPILEAIRN